MGSGPLSIVALIGYVAVCFGIYLWTLARGKRSEAGKGIERESLGPARYPWGIIAITVAATMLGPADALGLANKGFTHGMLWFFAPLGAALAQIVAGIFFVHRIKAQAGNPQTIGDFFHLRFGGSARFAVGILITLQAIAFSGLLILAGAQILFVFLGIPQVYGIIFVTALIGFLTATGGLATVVNTDVFQGGMIILMLLVIFGSTVLLFVASPSLWEAAAVPQAGFESEISFLALLTVMTTYFLGELLLPVYSQRALMARTPRAARIGFLVAGLLAGVWYLVVTASGAAARNLDVANPEFVLLGNLEALFTQGTAGYYIVVFIAFWSLLSLAHSTFDAILNTGGTSLARDVIGSCLPLSSDEQGKLARLSMLVIAAAGMLIPFIWGDLIEILLVGYTIWAPTMLPIFAWIILTPTARHPHWVFWISLSAGLIGWGVTEAFFANTVPAVLIGAMLNMLVLLIASRTAGSEPPAEGESANPSPLSPQIAA